MPTAQSPTMKKLLLATLLLFPNLAWAQCSGVFPPATLCGNNTGTPATPAQFPASSITGIVAGTNGQIQYNNAGAFGGFTATQDCTITPSTGVVTCLKTNNVAFQALATLGVGANLTSSGGNLVALPPLTFGGRLALRMTAPTAGIPTIDTPAVGTKNIVLAPGTTTWTVPLDFTSTNTITAYGATGGSGGSAGGAIGGASGGGAWATVSNQTLTPGATVTVNVPVGGTAGVSNGDGGAATDAYLCNTLVTNCASIAGTAVLVGAKSGAPGLHTGAAALGGAAGSSVGTSKFSGGNSGIGGSTGGAGAGGVAGPAGAGGNGVNGSGAAAGAGGTGDGGVIAGGAVGQPGSLSLALTDTVNQRVASIASGGGGITSGTPPPPCVSVTSPGSANGIGGGVVGGSNGGNGTAGCPGAIDITYTPSPTVINYMPCAGYIADCGGPYVPIFNGTSIVFMQFTSAPTDNTGPALTLTTGDNTAGNCYDIYIANNSGPFLGTSPAWASCTPGSASIGTGAGTAQRATYLGVIVNANAMTIKNNGTSFSCPQFQCSALGTIHVGVNGQVAVQIQPNMITGGPNSEVGLYNFYHRWHIVARGQDNIGSYVYNTAANRNANNSANNRITVLDGLGVEQMKYWYGVSATSNASWAYTNLLTLNQNCNVGITGAVGLGAYVVQAAGSASGDGGMVAAMLNPPPSLGPRFMQVCDGSVAAAVTIFGGLDFGQYTIETNF